MMMSRTGSIGAAFVLSAALAGAGSGADPTPARPGANLALVATSTTSYVSGHETIAALNDGSTPAHSNDKSRGAYGNWPRSGTQWVQYDWSRPVTIDRMDIYWFDDRRGVRLPKACRLKTWEGSAFVEVAGTTGLGLE
ncbi:MAG: Tat pathway signal protein, partial [Planctomycetes bacterium]|nr:Tat pathway signal protein [Planctomycetota bacterium]